VCDAILMQEPRHLCDVRPEVPSALADVVTRCLQKEPGDRFQTVADLAVALLPFAPPRALAIAEASAWIRRAAIQSLGSGRGDPRVSASYPVPASEPRTRSTTPMQVSQRPGGAARPDGRRGRWLWIGAAAMLLLLGVGYAARAKLGRPAPSDVAAATLVVEKPAPPAPSPLVAPVPASAPAVTAPLAIQASATAAAPIPSATTPAAPLPSTSAPTAPSAHPPATSRPHATARPSVAKNPPSAAAATPEAKPVAPVPPPVAPGHRDLGY